MVRRKVGNFSFLLSCSLVDEGLIWTSQRKTGTVQWLQFGSVEVWSRTDALGVSWLGQTPRRTFLCGIPAFSFSEDFFFLLQLCKCFKSVHLSLNSKLPRTILNDLQYRAETNLGDRRQSQNSCDGYRNLRVRLPDHRFGPGLPQRRLEFFGHHTPVGCVRIQQVNGSLDGEADVPAGVENFVTQGEVGQRPRRGVVDLSDGVNHHLRPEEGIYVEPFGG